MKNNSTYSAPKPQDLIDVKVDRELTYILFRERRCEKGRSALIKMVLFLHVAIILFNVVGLIAIPLGAWRRWSFVRVFWWRVLHVASWTVVALQALLGRLCFLTLWQDVLTRRAGGSPAGEPLVQGWVMRLIFWPFPLWVFTTLYVVLWVCVLFLWWRVPPRRRLGQRRLP